jgi:MFS family permease
MTDPRPDSHPAHAPAGLRQYAAVWRLPGGKTLLVAGVLGRLPVGMAPLALVLLVEQNTGSYAPAGAATAFYALANAVLGPLLGRFADRIGPVRVLLATAVAYPLAVTAVLAAVLADARIWLIWLASALLGACLPPLTATVRSVWANLTQPPADRLREPALALETTAFEVVFVVGPMLVGGLAAIASPVAAFVAAALLAAGGTAAVALGQATRAWRPHPDRQPVRGLGPAVAPGMPLLLAVAAGITFAFGIVGVAVPAFAGAHAPASQAETVAGLLLGIWGVGSVAGGVWFGTRRFAVPLPTQWAVALFAVAAGMAVLAVVPSVPVMVVALLLGGCTLAPALTVENALVARIAPPGMVNEAYTWVATIAFAASAVGAAVAGVTVDLPGGVPVAFGVAGVSTAFGAAVAAWPRTALRRAEQVEFTSR